MKKVLLLTSVFAVVAGLWLALMENVLRHDGYAVRSLMDGCITFQAIATLLVLLINAPRIFRYILSAGGLAMFFYGATSITRMLGGNHFEGFVFVIGAALMLEGMLTPMVLLGHRSKWPANGYML